MFMRKIALFLALVCVSILTKAQQPGPPINGEDSISFKKIMIIPFEEHMYLCPIQSNLAAASGKNHQQIVRYFRYGLASELQNKFLYLHNTTSLIHHVDTTKDLLRTYSSIAYQFETFKEELTKEEAEKIKKKKRKTSSSKKKIKNGQLTSRKSTEKKYASLRFTKPEILDYLNHKYHTDLYVFITELDIENDISDQFALAHNTYVRHLRAHYAVVNFDGTIINKGVVATTFPNKVNKVSEIKTKYFPVLADKLSKKLPGHEEPEQKKIDPLEKIRLKK